MEASRLAEAKRLADLEANRPRGRNSPLSVKGEAFCRSLAANALIQGGKPSLLSQMSQQLDVCLAPAEHQPFINLALLGSNAFRLKNMKLAFLGENLINKAYETCKNMGDLSIEANRRKVEQTIVSYQWDQQVVATNLINKYLGEVFRQAAKVSTSFDIAATKFSDEQAAAGLLAVQLFILAESSFPSKDVSMLHMISSVIASSSWRFCALLD
jgi:hypothetical protein